MKLRADKYVWAVRLAKTRSKATELINKGKVLINDERIKPAKEIKRGDIITVLVHNAHHPHHKKRFLHQLFSSIRLHLMLKSRYL